MPIYSWQCDKNHTWDVASTIDARNEPSSCPVCKKDGTRILTAPAIDKTAAGGWNQQSFNHGLGCWTKNQKHARQVAKSRGLEEVGTEPVENIIKSAENRRQEIRSERWADADRDKLYD